MCPIYEYECSLCRRVKEELHKYDVYKVVYCVICNKEMLRQVSLSSFRLRGKGWSGATIKHGKNYYGEGLD